MNTFLLVEYTCIYDNPLMPVGNYSYQFFICCPRDCVSRPLKPLRVDSVLRALSTLRGLRGAPEVPPLCLETQSLGQQMLKAPLGINGLMLLAAGFLPPNPSYVRARYSCHGKFYFKNHTFELFIATLVNWQVHWRYIDKDSTSCFCQNSCIVVWINA